MFLCSALCVEKVVTPQLSLANRRETIMESCNCFPALCKVLSVEGQLWNTKPPASMTTVISVPTMYCSHLRLHTWGSITQWNEHSHPMICVGALSCLSPNICTNYIYDILCLPIKNFPRKSIYLKLWNLKKIKMLTPKIPYLQNIFHDCTQCGKICSINTQPWQGSCKICD